MSTDFKSKIIILSLLVSNFITTYFIAFLITKFFTPWSIPMSPAWWMAGINAISILLWTSAAKPLPKFSASDAIAKMHKFKVSPVAATFDMIWLSILYWPITISVLYQAVKYRARRVLVIRFSKKQFYTIALNKKEIQRNKGKGISEQDIDNYFVEYGKEYLVKDSESLSYLLIQYKPDTILKSFGYLNGFTEEKHVFTFLGVGRCPLKAKAAEELDMDYSDVTDNDVAKHIAYI